MPTDLLGHLRMSCELAHDKDAKPTCLWCEAADEIKRLRSALDAEGNDANLLMLEIERLRDAGDALAASVETALHGSSLDIYATLAAWKEARRG